MKNFRIKLMALTIILFSQIQGMAAATPQGKVYFKNLKNDQTISTPFKVEMGVEGMSIKKAGETPDDKTAGHHHLIIDGTFIPEGTPIPTDDKHLHFGKGQTEMELKLAPGKDYKLTLQFADGVHRSYGEKLSSSIKIHVK